MKSSAKRLFMILIGLNLALLGAILVAFTTASRSAQQKSHEISELKADVETNSQAIDNYKALQRSINANRDVEAIAKKVLPTDKEQSVALAELDKFSRDVNLPILQISFNQGTNKGTGQTLTSPSGLKGVSVISVLIHSSKTQYENVLAFLKKIEDNQRRMQVTSIVITPNSTTPNLLDKVDLTIDIYLKAGT